MLSDLVIWYLFFGGVGGGACAVFSALEIADSILRPAHRYPLLPQDTYARGWCIATGSLALGIVCLMADIGHVDRVLNLLVSPTGSPMTIGAYALVITLCVCGAMAVIHGFDGVEVSDMFRSSIVVVGICAGIIVVVYAGLLLSEVASVLFWMTPFLPIVFGLSSLSCGVVCVFVAGAFSVSRQDMGATMRALKHIDTALVGGETAVAAGYLAWGALTPGPDLSAMALLTGDLSLAFWFGFVAVGLVAPLVMERFVRYNNYRTQYLIIAGSVLIGALVLRYCIVASGCYDVTQLGFMAW